MKGGESGAIGIGREIVVHVLESCKNNQLRALSESVPYCRRASNCARLSVGALTGWPDGAPFHQEKRKGVLMRRGRGFTLIEVLIVVAVIGILAAVAWPSYNRYVTRGRRSDAQQFMLDISSRQEQYLLDARAYATALDSTGLNLTRTGWNCSSTTCSNAYYDITIAPTAGPPPAYTLTATAKGAQLTDGNLTLNNLGVRTPADRWQ